MRRILSSCVLTALIWLFLGVASPAMAERSVGRTSEEAAAWAKAVCEHLANRRFDEARRMFRSAIPQSSAEKMDRSIDIAVSHLQNGGRVVAVDTIDRRDRGTTIIVVVEYIKLQNTELYVAWRFHRENNEWHFRQVNFYSDYKELYGNL